MLKVEPLKILAVVGATASGKTQLGIDLGREIEGEIISSDSMQIYRHMDIGTAKPTMGERAVIPHHLIDILDPDETYNAGQFIADADKAIQQIHQQRKTPIVLGGTGLYLRSLLHGIIIIPPISDQIKENIETLLQYRGLPGCYAELKRQDPESAERLHPNDISRITRALEVVWQTGKSITFFQNNHRFQQNRYRVLMIGVFKKREELYQRINQRVRQMVEDGLIEETRSLLDRGYAAELPSMKSIGYKQSVAYLNGMIDKDTMIADIQQKSRIYAKKQITWHKKNKEIHWLDRDESKKTLLQKINAFLENRTDYLIDS